jgi:hypothetical protein
MTTPPLSRSAIDLPLREPTAGARKTLVALCIGLPLLVFMAVTAFRIGGDAAAQPAWLAPLGATGLAFVVTVAVTLPLAWFLQRAMQRNRICIDDGALLIHTSFYRLRVALGELDLAAARVLSLDEHREWRPLLKTNGFSLPGYHSGHFRLRNRKKAFCAVTGDGRIAVIPRRDGNVLLLAFRQPEQALTQLREALGHA